MVLSNSKRLKQLHAYDKNGSHEKAILNALSDRDKLKLKLKEILKGETYEDWKNKSSKITALKVRLKKARDREQIVMNEISKL